MDEELRMVQLLQLKIAKEIKRICEKKEIPFILIGGTLLGAIRHEGFIPWDDDLDIGFTRDNYIKFIEAAKVELGNEFFLQEWNVDPNYAYPFGKIRLNDTLFVEDSITNRDSHMGIFVDIFPYDSYPNNQTERKILRYKLTILRQMICVKTKYCKYVSFDGDTKRQVLKIILFPFIKLYAMIHKKEFLIKKFEKIATKYNTDSSCSLVYEHSGASQYGKWVMPIKCFSERTDHVFEDDKFSIPKDFDTYLRIGYGDYMTPPPENKRENRHGITQIDFGPYNKERK